MNGFLPYSGHGEIVRDMELMGSWIEQPVADLAILLGATGGFLVYNLYPASIFMGDSGSLLLGLTESFGIAAPRPSLQNDGAPAMAGAPLPASVLGPQRRSPNRRSSERNKLMKSR